MDASQYKRLSSQLGAGSKALRYPSTPDLASRFLNTTPVHTSRRVSFALAAALVVLASLLAVPEVRASIVEFLQIGGVRITLPQAQPTQPEANRNQDRDYGTLVAVAALEGETTLSVVRRLVNFDIPLPGYPTDLGEPDQVFLQDFDEDQFVILVWTDEDGNAELAMYVLGPDVNLTKNEPQTVEVVSVNGQPGAWVTGDHFLFFDGECCEGILVQAPALVWQVGEITYRLESNLSLEEAIRVAESIN